MRRVVLWLVLFLICAGLGYPTLARYDPRTTPGVNDSSEYAELVVSGNFSAARTLDQRPRPRFLIPWVAQAIHGVVEGHTRSANPVMLALLLANAAFCATAALILIDLAVRILGDDTLALFAGTLYLLNFTVSNLMMSAMVDSGEACMMLAITWAMFTQRWFLLPLLGAIGACAKETFLPFAAIYTGVWWWLVFRHASDRERWPRLVWILAMDVAISVTLIALWSTWYHQLISPWSIALVQHSKEATFMEGLWGVLTSHGLLYVFGWLAPLGVWKLKLLPRPWVLASLATAGFALLLGAWDDSGSNIARAMFNVAGPVLTLSAAMLLAGSNALRQVR